MNCESLRRNLDEYLEDQLPESLKALFEQSLENCPEIAEEVRQALALRDTARELPKVQQPERDLWPGISSRLEPRSEAAKPITHSVTPDRRSIGSFYRIAAIITLLAATSLITYFLTRSPDNDRYSDNNQPVHITPLDSQSSVTDDIKTTYAETRIQLMAQLEKHHQAIDSATALVIRNNLRKIEEAINEIEHALQKTPNDPGLITMREAMRKKEVSVLRHALDLATVAM